MAKPYKLPSGMWAVRPYADGERAFFTAKTRTDVKLLEAEWLAGKRARQVTDLTLITAIKEYIDNCSATLSPSTVYGYMIIYHRLESYDIGLKRIDRITGPELQRLANTLAKKYSPKTVRNTMGLVTATCKYFSVSVPDRINLPQQEQKKYNVPTNAEINTMLEAFAGTDMETATMLAAFAGLRRSEIAALTSDDIDHKRKCLYIHAAVVLDKDNNLVKKTTKTQSSTRTVILPNLVYEHIKDKQGPLCNMTPKQISNAWDRIRRKHGIGARFHDLRHYSASLSHAVGVRDQYIMSRHGWKTDYALKSIYRNELDDFTVAMNKKVNKYIDRKFS